MRPATVQQLQTWSQGMKHQLTKYPAQTVMILGVAGGNGLEQIAPQDFQTVYRVVSTAPTCKHTPPDIALAKYFAMPPGRFTSAR